MNCVYCDRPDSIKELTETIKEQTEEIERLEREKQLAEEQMAEKCQYSELARPLF